MKYFSGTSAFNEIVAENQCLIFCTSNNEKWQKKDWNADDFLNLYTLMVERSVTPNVAQNG